jgi:hypothetical protein
MVAEFGMSPEVGLVSADAGAQGGAPSAALQSRIDDAVRALTDRLAERANEIVRTHRDCVERLADALVGKEVLTSVEIRDIAVACGVPVDGIAAIELPFAVPAKTPASAVAEAAPASTRAAACTSA